jgi:hypothetical protein
MSAKTERVEYSRNRRPGRQPFRDVYFRHRCSADWPPRCDLFARHEPGSQVKPLAVSSHLASTSIGLGTRWSLGHNFSRRLGTSTTAHVPRTPSHLSFGRSVGCDLTWRPLLRAVQNAEHPHFIVSFNDFVDCDEWKRRERYFSRARNAAGAPEVRESLQGAGAFDDRLGDSAGGLGTVLSNVVADPLQIIRGGTGRASAAIAPIHAGRDVVVLKQLAFASSGAALFDLAAEPLVVVH